MTHAIYTFAKSHDNSIVGKVNFDPLTFNCCINNSFIKKINVIWVYKCGNKMAFIDYASVLDIGCDVSYNYR